MPLLLELMEAPHTGLRAAATDCVIEVVSKRMEPAAKVQLVEVRTVSSGCRQMARTVPAAVCNDRAPSLLRTGSVAAGPGSCFAYI